MPPSRRSFLVTAAGMTALAVGMSIGRFIFTPLLPLMQRDFGLSIAAGGWIASSNYLGYLAGALSCMWIGARATTMIRAGLAATAALTLAMGLTASLSAWLVLRFAAGVASAWVLVFCSAWTLAELAAAGRTHLAGLTFAGVGVGILVTGLLSLGLNRWGIGAATQWLFFGALATLLSLAAWPVLRGERPAPRAARVATAAAQPPYGPGAIRLTAAYGIAGFGYIIAATFLPVIARERIASETAYALFWPAFGLSVTIVGTLVAWRPPRLGNRAALAGCLALQAAGNAALAWVPGIVGLALGAMLVGGVFTTVVQFAMAEARALAPQRASALIGALTAAYGIGQIGGPIVAAQLAEGGHGFAPGLLVAAVLLAAGALIAYPEGVRLARRQGLQ